MNQLKEILDNLAPLTHNELSVLLSIGTHKDLRKNDCFIHQGEICQYSAFIEKGIFRHYMVDSLGKQKILKFSLQNEFVSDCESFMYQQPALYSIQAIEDAKIILFKNSQLKKISEQYPVFERINNQIVQQILASYKEHLMIIMNLSPYERYQYILQNKPGLILRISVTHLSQFLGLSRETVSRLRAKAIERIS